MRLKSIAVFCGSHEGNKPIYGQVAQCLGRCLADNSITLIYGGAKVGLMGRVADGALDADGAVVGIIPEHLVQKEISHEGITELKIVSTLHQRKQAMADLADAFILLPGGVGSLEEFFEIWTWAQLGLHMKPMGILNIDGFYDELLAMCEKLVEHEFVKKIHHDIIQIAEKPEDLIGKLMTCKMDYAPKWVGT